MERRGGGKYRHIEKVKESYLEKARGKKLEWGGRGRTESAVWRHNMITDGESYAKVQKKLGLCVRERKGCSIKRNDTVR